MTAKSTAGVSTIFQNSKCKPQDSKEANCMSRKTALMELDATANRTLVTMLLSGTQGTDHEKKNMEWDNWDSFWELSQSNNFRTSAHLLHPPQSFSIQFIQSRVEIKRTWLEYGSWLRRLGGPCRASIVTFYLPRTQNTAGRLPKLPVYHWFNSSKTVLIILQSNHVCRQDFFLTYSQGLFTVISN
jgi:hypothetical protein